MKRSKAKATSYRAEDKPDNSYVSKESPAQEAFKNGAGTASSLRVVESLSFLGDEPTPPLSAHFLERALRDPDACRST